MKRIVGVISFMNPGGAQEAMLRLMRQLRRRGYDAEVWFLYAHQPCYSGEEHVRLLLDQRHPGMRGYFTLFARLVRAFWHERPDAVIGFLPLGNVLGLSAAALAGVRPRIAAQRTPSFALSPLMRGLDRVLGATPVYQAIVCVGNEVKRSFAGNAKTYCRKLHVVPNGIEWSPSPLSKAQARARFGLPQGEPLFVATGRFGREKNYPFLVEAVQRIPALHVAIAGDGELLPQVRELSSLLGISHRVHLLGHIERGDVTHFLRAGDAFVHTSLFEGHSNSILEAMHEGLPVIANDVPSIREAVEDEEGDPAARLCIANNFESWVDALRDVADDRAYASTLAEKARALVDRRFTLDAMVSGFEDLILSLSHDRPHAGARRAAA